MQRLFFAVLTAAYLTGCQNPTKDLEGTYLGEWSEIRGSHVVARAVRAEVPAAKDRPKKELLLKLVQRETHQSVDSIRVRYKNKELRLSLASSSGEEVILKTVGSCAQDMGTHEGLQVTFCANAKMISLFILNRATDHRIFAYLTSEDEASQLPTDPQGRYGLDDLLERTRSTGYEARLAAERLYQAREEVAVQRGKLLPRLGINTILSVVTEGWMGLIGAVGDLLPFIFPSNWFAFDQAKATYEAEVFAYRALIANQMSLTESLFHTIQHDTALTSELASYAERVAQIHTFLLAQEQMGVIKPESARLVENLKILVESDVRSLGVLQAQELAALAAAVGLPARTGIRELEPEPLPDPMELDEASADDLLAQGLATSLEIKQFAYLEQAARKEKTGISYSVVSLTGEGGLTASLPAQIRIAKSKIHELQVLRQQTQAQIEEQLVSLAAEINGARGRATLLKRGLENSEALLSRVQMEILAGEGFEIDELLAALESQLQYRLMILDLKSQTAITLGRIDRATLAGPYSETLEVALP